METQNGRTQLCEKNLAVVMAGFFERFYKEPFLIMVKNVNFVQKNRNNVKNDRCLGCF